MSVSRQASETVSGVMSVSPSVSELQWNEFKGGVCLRELGSLAVHYSACVCASCLCVILGHHAPALGLSFLV